MPEKNAWFIMLGTVALSAGTLFLDLGWLGYLLFVVGAAASVAVTQVGFGKSIGIWAVASGICAVFAFVAVTVLVSGAASEAASQAIAADPSVDPAAAQLAGDVMSSAGGAIGVVGGIMAAVIGFVLYFITGVVGAFIGKVVRGDKGQPQQAMQAGGMPQ